MKKILLTVVAAMLLVVMSVAGTLAYLTSTSQEVKNTFTVGNVSITLDEANVDEDGKKIDETRVYANEYKLQPGLTYIKDPTVTVKQNSEDCYVRVQVTVAGYNNLKDAFPSTDADFASFWNGEVFLLENLVNGWVKSTWIPQEAKLADVTKNDTSVVYEFWYNAVVPNNKTDDQKLAPLFTEIEMPQNLTNTQLDYLKNVQINVIAHAIQSEGFTAENGNSAMANAWAAWDSADAGNLATPVPTATPVATN